MIFYYLEGKSFYFRNCFRSSLTKFARLFVRSRDLPIQISNVNDVMCLIVVVTRQLTWQYVIGLQYKSSCVVTETVTLSHLSSMQNYCNNNARKWLTLIVSSAIARKFLHQKGLRAWSSCSVYGSFVEIPFYIFIHCSELQFLTSLKNIYLYIFSNFRLCVG